MGTREDPRVHQPYPGRREWGRTCRWSRAAAPVPASRTPTRTPATSQARNGAGLGGPTAGAALGTGVPEAVVGGHVEVPVAEVRASPTHSGPMAHGRCVPGTVLSHGAAGAGRAPSCVCTRVLRRAGVCRHVFPGVWRGRGEISAHAWVRGLSSPGGDMSPI